MNATHLGVVPNPPEILIRASHAQLDVSVRENRSTRVHHEELNTLFSFHVPIRECVPLVEGILWEIPAHVSVRFLYERRPQVSYLGTEA